MLQVEGTSSRGDNVSITEAYRYFKRIRVVHVCMAGFFLGTGVAALVLSLDSDGSAKIPYYFSAFISGAWHIVFLFVCQACMHYLSGDPSRAMDAAAWVKAYSIMCSVFVLFNVMGVVFTVVNGVCIEDQMCYYDKNEVANRFMAILLILQHCITIVVCVFLTKKAHLIDTELSSDVTIRLYHQFDFSKITARIRARRKSKSKSEKEPGTNASSPSIPSISTITSSTKDDVFAHADTTAAEMFEKIRKIHKSRSKSHPNLDRHQPEGATEIQGTLVSIYSDSDMTNPERKTLKSKFKIVVKPKNQVWPNESRSHHDLQSYRSAGTSGTNSDDESAPPFVFKRPKMLTDNQNKPSDNQGKDSAVSNVKEDAALPEPSVHQEILHNQKLPQDELDVIQKQQQAVLEQQTTVLNHQVALSSDPPRDPPPYDDTSVQPITDVEL